ncbi:MAG TPA: hypothetical protein VH681_14130 [Nitrospiraceae bacterium]
MQNKRLYVILGLTVLLVGAAAFLAGRMFSTGLGPRSESGALGSGQVFVSLNDITPAPELPTTPPEMTGLFVERKDNTVIVRVVSFDAGLGGIAGNAPEEGQSEPEVEVIVTGETTVYRETTEFRNPVAGQEFSIQQTVEEATLDDLNTQTMITVWGRKNGDRVIAEVFLYMNPLMIKKP